MALKMTLKLSVINYICYTLFHYDNEKGEMWHLKRVRCAHSRIGNGNRMRFYVHKMFINLIH